ncbi:hypothetical protein [Streptomyces spororaveus]|nr:hypothetical protein [Streptomyces spororaveus]
MARDGRSARAGRLFLPVLRDPSAGGIDHPRRALAAREAGIDGEA